MSQGKYSREAFAAAAETVFSFLRQRGFKLVRREATLLRFERSDVFLNVFHGRSSYLIGLELGRIDTREVYSLHEVLSVFAPGCLEISRCQSSDPVVVKRCLSEMAEVVAQHCGALLEGQLAAFDALRKWVGPRRRAYTLQATFGAIIDSADRAWEAKNFTLARELYGKSEEALDETQRRRLSYLRSKRY